MLVEIILGDAFGCGYEFTDKVPQSLEYVQHPKHLLLRPGMYTDDGQMSIANAEVLLETDDPSYFDFANAWVRCFQRDPRDGYARKFQDFLEQTNSGVEFIQKIRPFSDRSGAAMRAVPFGLLPDIEKVKNLSRMQAVLTHNSDGGIHSAMAVALAAHYLYYNLGHPRTVGHWVGQQVGISIWSKRYNEVHTRKPGNNGIECAHAAIHIIQTTNSFSHALMEAVSMGGDTDTVAAIVGGLVSCASHVAYDIPQRLRDELEDGSYGKTYCDELDRKLSEKFPRP